MQPSKFKFLLSHHFATNPFGLGRLYDKSSRQLQTFRHHAYYNCRSLCGCCVKSTVITSSFVLSVSLYFSCSVVFMNSYCLCKLLLQLCTYQCKSRGGGGGSAGKGWGFDKFYNLLIKFPRVGNERSIKCQTSPHPRGKI